MLESFPSNRFIKDLKLAEKRGLEIALLKKVIAMLETETALPEKFRDHALTGDWRGFRECHIQPDWLLVYYVETARQILHLARTGTHSDLFR